MEFPKPLMTISELESLGLSAKFLRRVAQTEGFPICIREGGKTSPIKFDTAELYKYIGRTSRMRERRQ